jgi:hypothetical protein
VKDRGMIESTLKITNDTSIHAPLEACERQGGGFEFDELIGIG